MSLTPQRLQRLVKHRERLERLQEHEYAKAQRLYFARLRALESTRADRERFLDAGPPADGPVDMAGLLSGGDYRQRVEREIGARSAALAFSEEDVSEERAALLERRRDRKAMEALLDHRIEDERLQQQRRENKRIDELAVTRWQRPGTGAPAGGEA